MDTPFIYDRYVTGRAFVGRKKECDILSNLLDAGEHVVMYEPPKSGKMSLIQQTLINMRSVGKQFVTVSVDLFNIRSLEEFLVKFGSAVIRSCTGIYYFRCRIPSTLTNGRAREVKISLKTGNLTSDLLDVILKVTDCSRRVIAESLETYNKGGTTDMNIVTEIRNRITQYIETSLIDQEITYE